MESEKVKEIKKALEYAIDMGLLIDKNTMIVNVNLADILTLINELESENETFLESKTMWKRLHTEVCKENQQLKDRITELEKENKDYYDRLNNLQTYIDNHEEIWKSNTTNALKQFAERLKEKATWSFIMCGDHKAGAKTVTLHDIDETLKEYTNENGKV